MAPPRGNCSTGSGTFYISSSVKVSLLEVKTSLVNNTVNEDGLTDYPVEFLNSFNISGLPDHIVKLKVGTPMILNSRELWNGPGLRATRLMRDMTGAGGSSCVCHASDFQQIADIVLF